MGRVAGLAFLLLSRGDFERCCAQPSGEPGAAPCVPKEGWMPASHDRGETTGHRVGPALCAAAGVLSRVSLSLALSLVLLSFRAHSRGLAQD